MNRAWIFGLISLLSVTTLTVNSLASDALLSGEALSAEVIAAQEADCVEKNQTLAAMMIRHAAEGIGTGSVGPVTLREKRVHGDEWSYVFLSSIYRADYELIVRTDNSCFPLSVELIQPTRERN